MPEPLFEQIREMVKTAWKRGLLACRCRLGLM